jgi:HEAT repeat protein
MLIDAMRKETLASIEETTAKPPDNLHGTNPTAGYAAQALSAVGSQAIPALVETLDDGDWWVRAMAVDVLTKIGQLVGDAVPALMERTNDEHWWVRRNAIEALGTLGSLNPDPTPLLVKALRDEDYRVRRNAALTLAKLRQPADEAIPALVEMLEDENRYNRFYAANALRRIDTSAARDALMNALFTARWCSITTRENQY